MIGLEQVAFGRQRSFQVVEKLPQIRPRLRFAVGSGSISNFPLLRLAGELCHAQSMPKRSSKELSDPVQNAFRVFQESVSHETEISLAIVGDRSLLSQVMAEIGRKGGRIGGKRRLKTMTPERRKEVAQLAAKKRWDGVREAAAKKEARKTRKST